MASEKEFIEKYAEAMVHALKWTPASAMDPVIAEARGEGRRVMRGWH